MTIVRAAGFKWEVDESDLQGKLTGDLIGPSHEDTIEGKVLALLPPGGVFLDVGAHVGHYSLRASLKADKVIAIEANPRTAARLEQNLALNNITNVKVYCCAAWDSNMELALLTPNNQVRDGSMRVVDPLHVVPQGMSVTTGMTIAVPLDDLLEKSERIDLIKLDVEGADLHALRGMRELLKQNRPVIFIEDHSIYGYYQLSDLFELLVNLGYSWHNGGTYGGATYFIAEPVK